MTISAEQILLRWRPALRQTGGLWIQPFSAQVRQYLLNHQRVFDAGGDFHAAAADAAGFDVDSEHPLQTLRPAHRCMADNGCGVFRPGRFGLATPTSPRRRHQRAMFTIGREHAVIARQIDPRLRPSAAGREMKSRGSKITCVMPSL